MKKKLFSILLATVMICGSASAFKADALKIYKPCDKGLCQSSEDGSYEAIGKIGFSLTELGELLDQAREKTKQTLGIDNLVNKAHVKFMDNTYIDFENGGQTIAGGLYVKPFKTILIPFYGSEFPKNDKELVDVLAHELTHAELAARKGPKAFPLWLEEGIAHQNNDVVDYSKESLSMYLVKHEITEMTFAKLSNPYEFYAVHQYLISKWLELYAQKNDGQNAIAAMLNSKLKPINFFARNWGMEAIYEMKE